MTRWIKTLVFLLACLAPWIAQAQQPQKVWHVGVLYWSDVIAGQIAMRKGLEQKVDRLNEAARQSGAPRIELWPEVAGHGPHMVDRQIEQMRKMIAARPDVIIVQPTDNAALAQALQEANQAGIPVVAYDQYISGGKLASYIASNNRQAGYLDGEYLASLFKQKDPLRLVLVEYPTVSSTVERVNGFMDALHDYGRSYTVLKTYLAIDPEQGRQAGAAILRDFPEKGSIDAVFTVNDGGGLAVVDSLAQAGRDEIAVATVDGDPASVKNIREKRLTRIDAAQFCGAMGSAAAKAAYDILRGNSILAQTLIPTFPVTAETLDKYPGWNGPIPASFRKPWPAEEPLWQGKAADAK